MFVALRKFAKRSSHAAIGDLKKLYEFMNYFEAHPDPKCIPLFFSCLTPDSDPEIIQTLAHVLRSHNKEDVTNNLKQILFDENTDLRCWAAHLAVEFPSHKLIYPLTNMVLYDQDFDAVIFSSSALSLISEKINSSSIINVIQERINKEESEYLKQELRYIIEDIL